MASKPKPTGPEWDAWLKTATEAKLRGEKPANFVAKDGSEWYLDPKNEKGKPTRFSPKSMDAKRAESNVRRAVTKGKELQLQEFIDFAKRNLYPNPVQLGTIAFQGMVGALQYLSKPTTGTQYGHLSPITSPVVGGLEHPRSIIRQQTALNAAQSDRVPSKPAHRQAGLPQTRSAAIRADVRGEPVLMPDIRQDIVQQDLSQGRPRARTIRNNLNSRFGTIEFTASYESPLSPINSRSQIYGAAETYTNQNMGDFPLAPQVPVYLAN